jgi:hypothetical protein
VSRQLHDELATALKELGELEEMVVAQRGKGKAVLVEINRYNDLLDRLGYLEDTLDALEGEREGAVPAANLF